MTETTLQIDGVDGNIIHGFLNTEDNDKLIIHLHGMTTYASGLLEVTSSEFFENNGFDHYRVSLYAMEETSRTLPESTIFTHTKDIETVIEYFQNQQRYKQIFITAHSFSGLVALILNPQNITAMSLWDPSFDVTTFWENNNYLTHIPEQKQYHMDYGCVYVLGEDMVEEIKNYPDEKCLELASLVKTPTQMIIPEESIFLASPHTSPQNYRKAFAGDFDLTHINNANHIFSYHNNRKHLFEHTLRFFNTYT